MIGSNELPFALFSSAPAPVSLLFHWCCHRAPPLRSPYPCYSLPCRKAFGAHKEERDLPRGWSWYSGHACESNRGLQLRQSLGRRHQEGKTYFQIPRCVFFSFYFSGGGQRLIIDISTVLLNRGGERASVSETSAITGHSLVFYERQDQGCF